MDIAEDSTRIVMTEPGVGDEVQFTKTVAGGLRIEIEEPWAGSTETGFGAQTSVSLGPEELYRLKRWLALP
jgi:hypothetical protein